MDKARITINAVRTGYAGKGVTIAFLDTGLAPADDLARPAGRIAAFLDLVGGKRAPYDDNAHGTHVP